MHLLFLVLLALVVILFVWLAIVVVKWLFVVAVIAGLVWLILFFLRGIRARA